LQQQHPPAHLLRVTRAVPPPIYLVRLQPAGISRSLEVRQALAVLRQMTPTVRMISFQATREKQVKLHQRVTSTPTCKASALD
jgi:hypothetical protein